MPRERFKFLHSPAFHLYATIIWIGLAIPTIIWWRNSVFWVALMSLYAIVVSHWSAYQASRSEEETKKLEKKIDNA